MNYKNIDLSKFEYNPNLLDKFNLLVTIKSFNLQEIRKRYLKSRKRGKTGSVKRRKPTTGGIVLLTIDKGKIVEKEIVAKLMEPRGIDYKNGKLALSSEDKIYIFQNDIEPQIITYKWLSYIHTVKFNENSNKLLVASSGVDTVMEFNLHANKKIWEWNAWENGINRGVNPQTGETHCLTRDKEKAKRLKNQGKQVIHIENPTEQKLPTALRAAFINSAEYDSDGDILITMFHEGELKKIYRDSSELGTIMKGFNKPHGGMRSGNNYLLTDTAGGRVVLQDKTNQISYDFRNLAGKDNRLQDLEWLQTSHHKKDFIITVDSNRMHFSIIDIKNNKLVQIPFDKNWAVQDFIILNSECDKIIENVKTHL